MVLVGDKKYACETCIKGHRSSSCKHTDRPLFEIKKKGRPVTQCEHCRELRKTRQIHVKCVCESRDSNLGVSSSSLGQGGTMVSARAAFPSGLPEGLLEASVASRSLSEGSDSDQGARGCACKDDASCNCWTPRSSAKRSARPAARRGSEARPTSTSPGGIISQPAALVIHAHSGNNRPVLPKPPAERPVSPTRNAPISPPSAPLRGRSPSHGQSFYSPYGRAYEYAHGSETPYPPPSQSSTSYPPSASYPHSGERDATTSISPDPSSAFGAWQDSEPFRTYPTAPDPPPLCNCGSACACPGCLEHKGPNADPSASCVNPSTCSACLECNIVALTALSSEMTSSLYDPAQAQDVDRWLSQMSSMSDFAPASGSSNLAFSPSDPGQQGMRYDPSTANDYRTWSDSQAAPAMSSFPSAVESECCGGRCKCPAGMCRCPPDCCGCCQGCSCPGCDHDRSSGRTLTFATSGERAPCCGGGSHPENCSPVNASGPQSQFSNTRTLSSPSDGGRYADGSWTPQLLTVPRETLSRASSLSSSKSSPNPSTSSSSPIPYGDAAESVHATTTAGHSSGAHSCCTSMGNLSTRLPGGGAVGSPPRPQFSGGQSQRGFEPHNSSGFPHQPGARRYS